MRTITLEPVDNGIIRTIIDDNIDGAGKKLEQKEIFLTGDNIENTERFLLKIISDLGLYTGNPVDKNNLIIDKKHGSKYNLTNTEIIEEQKKLTVKLNRLKNNKQIKELNA